MWRLAIRHGTASAQKCGLVSFRLFFSDSVSDKNSKCQYFLIVSQARSIHPEVWLIIFFLPLSFFLRVHMLKKRNYALNQACEWRYICKCLKTHLKILLVMQNRVWMFAQMDICSTWRAGLSTTVFLDLWSKGALGPKTQQVVHKPIAHAWTSTSISPRLWQHYADGAWSPPHTPRMPSLVWLVLWVWTVNKALTQSAPADSSNHPHWKEMKRALCVEEADNRGFCFYVFKTQKGSGELDDNLEQTGWASLEVTALWYTW